jgi:hypothetical protein
MVKMEKAKHGNRIFPPPIYFQLPAMNSINMAIEQHFEWHQPHLIYGSECSLLIYLRKMCILCGENVLLLEIK